MSSKTSYVFFESDYDSKKIKITAITHKLLFITLILSPDNFNSKTKSQ